MRRISTGLLLSIVVCGAFRVAWAKHPDYVKLEKLFEKITVSHIKAYNENDWKAFSADLAPGATINNGVATEATFAEFCRHNHQDIFGKCKSWKLDNGTGMPGYGTEGKHWFRLAAKFDKRSGYVTAKFLKRNGEWEMTEFRLVQ